MLADVIPCLWILGTSMDVLCMTMARSVHYRHVKTSFQYLSHKASIDDLDVCLAMRPSVHGDCVILDDLNVTWFIDVCLAMRPSVHGDCVIPDDLNVT